MSQVSQHVATFCNTVPVATTDPSLDLVPPEPRDMQAFRTDSLRLAHYCKGDFSDIADVLREQIKNSTLNPRTSGLAGRYCRELAPYYDRDPLRTFAINDGMGNVESIDPFQRDSRRAEREAQIAKLVGLYTDLRVDRTLRTSSQSLVAQGTQVHACTPLQPLEGAPGLRRARMRLERFDPYAVAVEFISHPLETDIRYADKVWIQVPIQRPGDDLRYGHRVYTRKHAWIELEDEILGPLWPGSWDREDGDIGHNLGFIPLVERRNGDPMDEGLFFAALNDSLLNTQEGDAVAKSDVEQIVRHHTFPLDSAQGEGAMSMATQVKRGPNGLLLLPDGVTLNRLQSNPATDKYVGWSEWLQRDLAASSHLAPNSMSGSSGITGDAKAIEMLGRDEERSRQEDDWREFEQRLVHLIATMDRFAAGGAVSLPASDITVGLDFRYPQPKRNDLQVEQAFNLSWATGGDSPEERTAREEGVAMGELEGLPDGRLPMTAAARVKWRQENYSKYRLGLQAAGVEPAQLPGATDLPEEAANDLDKSAGSL